MATTNGKAHGKVVQVLGGVVDCEFPEGELPQLYDAIEVAREGQEPPAAGHRRGWPPTARGGPGRGRSQVAGASKLGSRSGGREFYY